MLSSPGVPAGPSLIRLRILRVVSLCVRSSINALPHALGTRSFIWACVISPEPEENDVGKVAASIIGKARLLFGTIGQKQLQATNACLHILCC